MAPGQSDQLYVLDIKNFTWVKNYNPINNSITLQDTQPSKSLDKTIIIIIVVIVVVVFVGVIIGVIIYRRKIKQLDDKLTVYQPYTMDPQVPASQIDSESIYTSSSNVPVTSKDMYQFNRDIKQLPRIPSNSSETSSSDNHNYASDANITHGDNDTDHYGNNMAHQYASNNNKTRQSLGNNNNVANQYGSNNNTIRQGVGGNNNNVAHQYASNNNTIRQNVSGNNNMAHQYAGNNNTTRQYVSGNNNMAHQYANNNNNPTRQYAGNNNTAHHNTDTNIAPANERFNLPPDQPYRVVMMNTQSGEMYIPPNAQPTSNNFNYPNRFSRQ